jgi:predicted lipoprotein
LQQKKNLSVETMPKRAPLGLDGEGCDPHAGASGRRRGSDRGGDAAKRQIAGRGAMSSRPAEISKSVAVSKRGGQSSVRLALAAIGGLILVAAMAFDTKIVKIGSPADAPHDVFSAAEFGKATFPKIQAAIEQRAVSAVTVAAAIAKDQAAAGKQYGVEAGSGPEISVSFTGVAGKQDSGIYAVQVDGAPDTLLIRVQTGPAINGTDLRDATGTIAFGQFTNQIDYQNAGSALNKEMKSQVLSKIDAGKLTGKTISVVGTFKLVNPKSWLVTPVKLDVQ